MTAAPLGPMISQWQLETAVLTTISTWLETYLSAVERAVWGNETVAILPRPGAPDLQPVTDEGKHDVTPSSIHGGVDFLTGSTFLMPEIIVSFAPGADPVYFGSGDYTLGYELSVCVQTFGQDETLSRMYCQLYGQAVMALCLQQGSFGGLVTRTRLQQVPHAQFVETGNEDDSQLVQAVAIFDLYVDSSVNDQAAIAVPVDTDPITAPDPSQLPPDWPTAETVGIALEILAIGSDLADATFTGPDVIQVSE